MFMNDSLRVRMPMAHKYNDKTQIERLHKLLLELTKLGKLIEINI